MNETHMSDSHIFRETVDSREITMNVPQEWSKPAPTAFWSEREQKGGNGARQCISWHKELQTSTNTCIPDLRQVTSLLSISHCKGESKTLTLPYKDACRGMWAMLPWVSLVELQRHALIRHVETPWFQNTPFPYQFANPYSKTVVA